MKLQSFTGLARVSTGGDDGQHGSTKLRNGGLFCQIDSSLAVDARGSVHRNNLKRSVHDGRRSGGRRTA